MKKDFKAEARRIITCYPAWDPLFACFLREAYPAGAVVTSAQLLDDWPYWCETSETFRRWRESGHRPAFGPVWIGHRLSRYRGATRMGGKRWRIAPSESSAALIP